MHEIDKGQLRKLALSKRNESDARCREIAAAKIAEKVLSLPELEKAEIIMCYRSFRSEVSTEEIVSALEAMGKKLCFPVCEENSIMHAWHPLDENSWKKGRMGITEPDREKSQLIDPADIDLVICPMVAFDAGRSRMGYGAGYYDRYLPKCGKAKIIGIAFELQRMEALVTDQYDRAMDLIITEEKMY